VLFRHKEKKKKKKKKRKKLILLEIIPIAINFLYKRPFYILVKIYFSIIIIIGIIIM